MTGKRVPAQALERFAAGVLLAAGASEENAAVVARSLAGSHLCGRDTHGLLWLERYVDDIDAGTLLPAARPSTHVDGATATVDGGGGFGQVAAATAARLASDLARAHRVGLVAVRHCHHLGRIGEFAEQIAAGGQAGLVLCRTGGRFPVLAAHGGREARLGTNPIAFAVPAPDGVVAADLAASASSESAVHRARMAGLPVPAGVVISSDGEDTSDPAALYQGGALLPAGGHKGFALALLGELFAGGLTGTTRDRAAGTMGRASALVLAIELDAFAAATAVHGALAAAVDDVKSSTPRAGAGEVLLPGERARRCRQDRRRAGVPIEPESQAVMTRLGSRLGVDVPRLR